MAFDETIQVQHQGQSHVHAQITIIPTQGFNRGLGLRVLTCESIDYGNGTKHVYLPGTQLAPVTLAPGKSEPTWKMTIAKHEWHNVVRHIGPGYLVVPFKITCIWRVPGQPIQKDIVSFCMIEDDGVKSKTGDATMVDSSGKCQGYFPDGLDPFTFPRFR